MPCDAFELDLARYLRRERLWEAEQDAFEEWCGENDLDPSASSSWMEWEESGEAQPFHSSDWV